MKLSDLKIALQAEFEKLATIETLHTYRTMMVITGRYGDSHTYTLTLTHKGGKASVLIALTKDKARSVGLAVVIEESYDEAIYSIRHQLMDHYAAREYWK